MNEDPVDPEHSEAMKQQELRAEDLGIHTDFTKNATFYTNHHWLVTPGPRTAPATSQLSAGSASVLSFLLPRTCSSNNSLSLLLTGGPLMYFSSAFS